MDERARYFRRLKRLRGSARRWSVLGGGLTAAAAVLTPYAGIGPGDAGWAAAAGASAVLAVWRWKDHRELAATPAPPPALPEDKLSKALQRFPAGQTVLREVRRQRSRYALRGSAIADAWDRLDRASQAMVGLAGRLTGAGETAMLEAATAEQWLRDLGQRVASVERAIPVAQPGQREALTESHAGLADQFAEGVAAYEQLVAAAASYVAEDGHPVAESRHPAYFSLVDAADRLRGIAEGLAELRTTEFRTPPGFAATSPPSAAAPTSSWSPSPSASSAASSPSASSPSGSSSSASSPVAPKQAEPEFGELSEARTSKLRTPPGSRSSATG
ncbi:hypothetical protein BC793_103123 [Actinoplanes xinjiangensis]|uniref:Uncharacterized protein n=1 Tax=Actinoplanes xinjiangensis TaxID=512350 RepID=A0A316FQ07_9ACTN|nr:hypothetical protein BC793_103123 [Actinoplanes xinjiangensis]GIF36129.1 hypothetical protein Axi01nite_04400 [Actinoplanes xinjiangensis]